MSDVPSERRAEGGVAKRQASAAGPRPESSPSLLLYSSKRKRTHTCSSPSLLLPFLLPRLPALLLFLLTTPPASAPLAFTRLS